MEQKQRTPAQLKNDERLRQAALDRRQGSATDASALTESRRSSTMVESQRTDNEGAIFHATPSAPPFDRSNITNPKSAKTYSKIPETVTYVLPRPIEMDKKNKRFKCPAVWEIPEKDEIAVDDHGNPCTPSNPNSHITPIEYVLFTNSTKTPDGRVVQTNTLGQVVLTLGRLTLSPRRKNEDRKLYDYLEKTNYNGSNPFRDTTKEILFVRLDPAGNKRQAAQKELAIQQILQQVREEWYTGSGRKKLMDYAIAIGINTKQFDGEVSEEEQEAMVLHDLLERVKQDHEKFNAEFGSDKMNVYTLINKAVLQQIIFFSPPVNKWLWMSNKGEICAVGAGFDNKQALFMHLEREPQTKSLIESMVS